MTTDRKQFYIDLYQAYSSDAMLNIRGQKLGTVSKVTNDEFLFLNIDINTGGTVENVPYFGACIDKDTGNIHGQVIMPRVGSLAVVGFVNGDYLNPICLGIVYIASSSGNDETDRYANPKQGVLDVNNIYFGHYSGTLITMKPDGEVSLTAGQNQNVLFTIDKTGNVKLNSVSFTHNDGTVGVARKGDFVVATKDRTGKPFLEWAWDFEQLLEDLITAITNAVTVPMDGGTSFKSTILAYISPKLAIFKAKYTTNPSSIISEIVSGSTEFKIKK